MPATTIRGLIAEQIKADNAAYIVHNFPTSAPDNLVTGKVYVNVYRERLINEPATATVGQDLKCIVIVAKAGTEIAEDELENALYEVLVSINSVANVDWTDAERAIISEKYIGYEITLQAHTKNIFKS